MKSKKDKVVAVLPAAGLGMRFGQDRNKPFYPLLGRPLIIWPLQTLQETEEITEILPVLKEEDLATCAELIDEYGISKVRRIVPGGKERQDSIYNAIREADEDTSLILVHDGARPLIERALVSRAIQELISLCDSESGIDGVVPGVPVKDTIKEIRSQKSGVKSQETESGGEIIVEKTLNRGLLRAVQTPQVFCFQKLMNSYKKAMAEGYYATDDAALLERCGGRIKIIMGSYNNIKITTPEDIFIAEAMLKGG